MTTTEYTPDVELYEKLAKPVTQKEADKRINRFMAKVRKLREEYSIPEIVCVVAVNTDDGETAGSVLHYGDARRSFHLVNAARQEIMTVLAIDEAEKISAKKG